ncbi:glycosyltransferase family 4 protein [Nocardia sp. NPDC051570]|uniref:glycosyltransferase family 4 protein n=1 Tax=Nocardia sp. NPDC051570 TaxID=3364324 RepID=UPI0037BA6C43
MSTRGGVATFVRQMRDTPIWAEWDIRHVATHRDGGVATKLATYAQALFIYVYRLAVHRPSIVHLHISSYGSFPRKYLFELIARAARTAVVLHVHGSDFSVFYDEAPRALRVCIRDSLRGAAVVVALGEPWAVALRDIAPDARIIVVPNAIRPASRLEPPSRSPDAGAPVQVLFLGEVGERKGTFTLLDAWQRMIATTETTVLPRLVIAGDGAVERARELVAQLGIESTVEITGWLAPHRVPDLIGQSQALVLPSHREGQPMAILEAMAKGLCVVTCPVGGIPDLIDERCGLMVPPGAVEPLAEALGRVVRDDDLRTRLGENALQRVRDEFDIDVVWRRFDRIYRSVMAEPGTSEAEA